MAGGSTLWSCEFLFWSYSELFDKVAVLRRIWSCKISSREDQTSYTSRNYLTFVLEIVLKSFVTNIIGQNIKQLKFRNSWDCFNLGFQHYFEGALIEIISM